MKLNPRAIARWRLSGSSRVSLLIVGTICLLVLCWARLHVGCVLVVGDSMLPTFKSGDLLLIRKSAFDKADPQRGDIVVGRFRREFIVKRVVGLPQECVEVVRGRLYVNGEAIPEDYIGANGTLCVKRGEMLPGSYALLGDNRHDGDSLLFYAVLPREQLAGKVIYALRYRWGEWRLWRV